MKLRVVASFVAGLALPCCSLAPKPVELDYYVLAPLTRPSSSDATPASKGEVPTARVPVVAVSRVTLPDYLDRVAIATRVEEHRLVYSQRNRWAEPLENGFARTVRQNLGLILGARASVQAPSLAAMPDVDVRIDVLRFEQVGTRQVELWARFTLAADGELVHAGETRRVEPIVGEDAAALTEGLSRSLGHLSRAIADAVLTALSNAQAPDAPQLPP